MCPSCKDCTCCTGTATYKTTFHHGHNKHGKYLTLARTCIAGTSCRSQKENFAIVDISIGVSRGENCVAGHVHVSPLSSEINIEPDVGRRMTANGITISVSYFLGRTPVGIQVERVSERQRFFLSSATVIHFAVTVPLPDEARNCRRPKKAQIVSETPPLGNLPWLNLVNLLKGNN